MTPVTINRAFSAMPVTAGAAAVHLAAGDPNMADPFALVVSREREVLLRGKPADLAQIKAWEASLGPDGRWPDIDYADQSPANWKTSEHLVRTEALCRALSDPANAADTPLEAATMRALDEWITARYHNPNWWHNDIGVPTLMRDIILLLGDRLQGERRAGALAVLDQYGRAKSGGGANTVWEAELGMDYGLLTHDSALVSRQSGLIAGEIKIGAGEGIQSDWSFHQHGMRLQQFHYGGAFLANTSRLGWVLHSTPWAIGSDKMQILADCVLEGSQWMARGVRTVPGTIDRAVSRPESEGADLRTTARYLRDAVPQQAAALDALIARQDGHGTPLVGFRAYPRSDFSAYQRPGFSVFLKTVSDRTLTTEVGLNGENLKGQKLGCGDLYVLRDGQEYANLQPVWDWDLLPGLTWAMGAGEVQRRPFVGAISDGVVGATAMDYAFGPKTGPAVLTARKFWACDGDTVVCLIGALHTDGIASPVRTALDQCLLRGAVTVADAQGAIKILSVGTTAAQSVRWIHHSGLVYLPIGSRPVSFRLGPETGSWHDINHGYSTEPVTSPVFLPVLEQGLSPDGQASGFVIAPSATPTQAEAVAAHPTWQILRNDAECQAVRFTDGDVMAAFYQPGKIESGGKALLEVDTPCLALLHHGLLRLCDPTQKGGAVHVSWAGKGAVSVSLPPGGLASVPLR